MTLPHIEKKAMSEIKEYLQYSLDSINDILECWNSPEWINNEIKTLIRDYSNITFDQYGHLERLGIQNTEVLRNLVILGNYVQQQEKQIETLEN